jgi:hypothetical protein
MITPTSLTEDRRNPEAEAEGKRTRSARNVGRNATSQWNGATAADDDRARLRQGTIDALGSYALLGSATARAHALETVAKYLSDIGEAAVASSLSRLASMYDSAD